MGQEYIARAILDHFEGVHVQSFDLATLMSDSPSLVSDGNRTGMKNLC